MASALNLTAKLKQDPESKKKLQALKDNFATHVQPAIDAALAKSETVHFARVLVIDDQYIQVMTEFDGDRRIYTDFFLKELPAVFEAIFDLAEGAPPWAVLSQPDKFFEVAQAKHVRSLGGTAGDSQGYLFDATRGKTVQQIKAALEG